MRPPESPRPTPRIRILSIRFVVSLTAAITTGLSVLVLGFYSERSIRETLLSETQLRMITAARDLAINASAELLTEYPQLTLHTLVKSIQKEQPELEMVVVLDHEGLIQGHPNPRLLGTSFDSPEDIQPVHSPARRDFEGAVLGSSGLLVVTTPVQSTAGKHLGDVYLGVSKAHIEGAVLDARLKNLLVVALCLIPGVLLTSIMMTRLLKPVGELKQGLKRIGEGDFDTPVTVRGITDLAMIADAINDTAGNLKTAKAEMLSRDEELREAHDMLELHVIDLQNEITERERVEKELRLSKKQLFQSQKMEAIGQLAGGIAHDFNNILHAINGYASLITRKVAPGEKVFGYAEEVQKACDRAADLIRKLMTFSSKQAILPQIIDISECVREMESMLERVTPAKIKLEFREGPGIQKVLANASEIGQVIMNLVVNARDAMASKGGRIVVETSQDPGGPWVLISVSDDGEGMDEETQNRIFEPFFTTKGQGKGTGLGLATVYGIVNQSGGSITVESEVGRGTVFTVRLPNAKPEESSLVEEALDAELKTTYVVLVVEDEAPGRELVQTVLEESGYEVLTAGDGVEAIEVLDGLGREVDLVVSDVVMPRMNGAQLFEHLREKSPELRVLFMSAFSSSQVLTREILGHSCGLIQKPFTPEELLESISNVLSRRKAA